MKILNIFLQKCNAHVEYISFIAIYNFKTLSKMKVRKFRRNRGCAFATYGLVLSLVTIAMYANGDWGM